MADFNASYGGIYGWNRTIANGVDADTKGLTLQSAEGSLMAGGGKMSQQMQWQQPPYSSYAQPQQSWHPALYCCSNAGAARTHYGSTVSPIDAFENTVVSNPTGAWSITDRVSFNGSSSASAATLTAAAASGWIHCSSAESSSRRQIYQPGSAASFRISNVESLLASYNDVGTASANQELRSEMFGVLGNCQTSIATPSTGPSPTARSGKTRTREKYRTPYSHHQRSTLENAFNESRYVSNTTKRNLVAALQLSEQQIKIWFQNRRSKDRKQAKKFAAIEAAERFGSLLYERNFQPEYNENHGATGACADTFYRHSSQLNSMWNQLPVI